MQLTLPKMTQPIKLWDRLEIVVGDGLDKGLYNARVEDFTRTHIIISAPEYQQGSTLLRDNDRVVVIIAQNDAVYRFASNIRKSSNGKLEQYSLTLPSEVRRVQRREFVRIEYQKDIEIVVIQRQIPEEGLTWIKSRSINISGGGMLIRAPKLVQVESLLLVRAAFFDTLDVPNPVATVCRRAFELDGEHLAGLEFIRDSQVQQFFAAEQLATLPPSVGHFNRVSQNQLVMFVFNEQVELRKKGLL